MDTLERPQVDVSHYTYRVAWSVEDDEFVATVAEFPSLSWLAPSQVEALQGLEAVLADVVLDMQVARVSGAACCRAPRESFRLPFVVNRRRGRSLRERASVPTEPVVASVVRVREVADPKCQ